MAFGQASGPPASAAQIQELGVLFEQAGFESFREARHPYGLTQRQSNGKFTREEADELIERLTAEAEGAEGEGADGDAGGGDAEAAPMPGAPRSSSRAASVPVVPAPDPEPDPGQVVLAFPDEMLAEELTRRGWTCTPPTATG